MRAIWLSTNEPVKVQLRCDITLVFNLPPYYDVQHFIDLEKLTHTNQNYMMLKDISHNEHLEWRYAF